jgi:hypothetical protein
VDLLLARYRMTRLLPSRRWNRVLAGAGIALLGSVLFAPATARAGCSHLVTSRTDRVQFSHFLQAVSLEQARDPLKRFQPTSRQQSPLPPVHLPQSPRPCRGAWCADRPSIPAAPAGEVSVRIDSWAWCPAMHCLDPATESGQLEAAADRRPLRRAAHTFRPPRISPRAYNPSVPSGLPLQVQAG